MLQVEFYFSDSNLPKDKFLLSKVGGSANHSVPLSVIHSFKRMQRFQPFSAVVEALKSAETVQLTDNDTAVVRKVPLSDSVTDTSPEAVKAFEDRVTNCSIYAKGFGSEEPSTQYDIEAFFDSNAPTKDVRAVRLRRTYDKVFKGSVFVEFGSEEGQKNFLAMDPKPKWKGNELIIQSKRDHDDEKEQADNRSIFAKGFGSEESNTQHDIEEFFTSRAPTKEVRLMRTQDGAFKGSVFVEFDSEETQKKFLATDPKPKWNGKDLVIKSRKDYYHDRNQESAASKPHHNRGFRGKGGHKGGKGNRGAGDRKKNSSQNGTKATENGQKDAR